LTIGFLVCYVLGFIFLLGFIPVRAFFRLQVDSDDEVEIAMERFFSQKRESLCLKILTAPFVALFGTCFVGLCFFAAAVILGSPVVWVALFAWSS